LFKTSQERVSGDQNTDRDFDVSNIVNAFESIVGARRFAQSSVVQLGYRSQEELEVPLKYGIKI